MTISEWLRSAGSRLEASGIESFRLEAQLLAAHVLGTDRSFLLAHPDEEFNELAGESVLLRRLAGEPLAYILGWREFYGRRFSVGPSVLIPRHDTEILVEAALEFLGTRPGASVLDIGTGSGCIAVTLALEARCQVTAIDISLEALETAQRNASDLGADVRFVKSDGFAELLDQTYDLIVSNPPYIGSEEQLPREVIDFEPRGALISGQTGLEFYERLAGEAGDHLKGRLILEVGYMQAFAVEDLFVGKGWRHVETRRDMALIDRVVVFER